MDLRERAWTELGVIERFMAADQPREALARARHLEAMLEAQPGLEELLAFVVTRRAHLQEAVARWDDDVRRRHEAFVGHQQRGAR